MKTVKLKLYEFSELTRVTRDFAIDMLFMYLVRQKKIEWKETFDRHEIEPEIYKMGYLFYKNGLPVFGSENRKLVNSININGQIIQFKK